MTAIFKTQSNYGELNGKELDVVEMAGTRISCRIFSKEFDKDVTIDFSLDELERFVTPARFSIVLGLQAGFDYPQDAEKRPKIYTLFDQRYYIVFDAGYGVVCKIPCTGEDIKTLRNNGFIDKL